MNATAPATLNWVKPGDDISGYRVVSGMQGSNVRVVARSIWSNTPPVRFTVWRKPWFDRLTRALRIQRPHEFLPVAITKDKVSVSDMWSVGPPGFPGQAFFYFEDDAPDSNRSGLLGVTTKDWSSTFRSVEAGGDVINAGPTGVDVKVPLQTQRVVKTVHRLTAPVDPDVVATLLVPWGRDAGDLRDAISQWVDEMDLHDLLIREAAKLGSSSQSPENALEVVSGGFLSGDQVGWEIWIEDETGSGERRLSIGPEQPRDVVVNIAPPRGGGRASFALRVALDGDPSQSIIGTVIELEATESELHVSDGSLGAVMP